MLTSNLIFIFKGLLNPNLPPSILGITPMIVVSGSMSGQEEGHIEVGDMVFVRKVNAKELEVGDVIAFYRDDSLKIITHRITSIETNNIGRLEFKTKGDVNNVVDPDPVYEEQLIGIYLFRIPKLGSLALFLQEPLGMTIFIGAPILTFLLYDIILRRCHLQVVSDNTARLETEVAILQQQSEKHILLPKDS